MFVKNAVLAAITATGFTKATPRPIPLPEEEFADIRAEVLADRSTALLLAAVAENVVMATAEQVLALTQDWHQQLREAVNAETLLLSVAKQLYEAGIVWAVLKGAGLAHTVYEHPSLRCFADVDVLIHPAHWKAAVKLLDSQASETPQVNKFVARYGKGRTVQAGSVELDLHRRLAVGWFGVRCDHRRLLDNPTTFSVAGQSIPVLSPSAQLVHASVHFVLGGNPGPRAARDVIVLAANDVVLRDAFDLAVKCGLAAVLHTAVKTLWHELDLRQSSTVDKVLAYKCSRQERRVLNTFATETSFRKQALTALPALQWYRRPHMLWSLARLSREHKTQPSAPPCLCGRDQ